MKFKSIAFRNYNNEKQLFVARTLMAFFSVLILFIYLIINLCKLQILHFPNYKERSNQNNIKILPLAPPNRGIIFDRYGIPLVFNRTTYQVELIPEKQYSLKKILKDLKPVLDLTKNDLINIENNYKKYSSFNSMPIKTNLNDVQIARFAVNHYRFPNLKLTKYHYRYYPYGSMLTHVIGYVSKINENDTFFLEQQGKSSDYLATNNVGKLGIEGYYEDILHGQIGYKKVEMNNKGHIIRQLHIHAPQSGNNIYLSIDLKLQKYIEKLMVNLRGAVIVSDPNTGEILSLVSTPSYNPNLFVQGFPKKEYNLLLNDKTHPLYNRTLQASYAPASTVKPYIAISALSSGLIDINTIIFDPGWWYLPGSKKFFYDWKKKGHGYLNITKSLEESSDTFFYHLAYHMGIDKLSEWMSKFGYGHCTGIDLLEESSGNMPTRKWKTHNFNKPWYQGDTISVGIGQGYWTATPLQMNKAIMILINNGLVKIPHVLRAVQRNQTIVPYIPSTNNIIINNANFNCWNIVKKAMYGVANHQNGTAYNSFFNAHYKIAAKSGTAQIFKNKKNQKYNAHNIIERLRDHKLMIAFAPYNKPRVAVTIIVENREDGILVGSIMRNILDYFILHNKHYTKPCSNTQGTFYKGKQDVYAA